MALSKNLKRSIGSLLEKKLDEKLKKYSPEGMVKPFLEALVSAPTAREASFIHSLYTLVGGKVAEKIAEDIAKENFDKVIPQKTIEGIIPTKASEVIRTILRDLGKKPSASGVRKPNAKKDQSEVIKACRGKGKMEEDNVDLYLKRGKQEVYIEMKTAKPNKRGARDTKRDILRFRAISHKRPNLKIFVGMIYNPYWPKQYNWRFPLQYLERETELIIGEEFWDFIGGKGTYKDLLRIVKNIAVKYKPLIQNKLKEIRKEALKVKRV